ncbi:MAG: response regulator [Opitutaceae bacterium]
MTLPPDEPPADAPIQERVRVLIVEDHPMVRRGMRSLIDSTEDLIVCGEASTIAAALETYERERPDVVCLDLMLGAADGIGLIEAIRRVDPEAKILVLSVKEEDAHAERCLEAGALGYSMKVESNEHLLTGIRKVARGGLFLSSRFAMSVLNRVHRPGVARGVQGLTEREMQVFQLVGLGMTTRQIAERLRIGIKTVETHRESIKNKLGFEHSAALVRGAVRWVKKSLETEGQT